MAEKKKTTAKKVAPKAPAPKPVSRGPKMAEVTERDLGPKMAAAVRTAAVSIGCSEGDVIRAMIRKVGSELSKSGPMGTRMALKRFL